MKAIFVKLISKRCLDKSDWDSLLRFVFFGYGFPSLFSHVS